MIIFESEFFELEHNPQFNFLELRWIGMLEVKQWELFIPHLITAANTYQVKSILIDASYVDADQGIASGQKLPLKQFFNGLRIIPTLLKVARVSSGLVAYDEYIKGQYATLLISYSKLEFRSFEHHYQAMYWLAGNPSLLN